MTDIHHWTAKFAPLGVASDDGRTLDPDGRWTVRDLAPLLIAQPDRARVGIIDRIYVADGWLSAAGSVSNDDVAAGMADKRLLPQMELDDADLDAETGLFRSGRIAAVVADENPAFDGVEFTIID